MVRFSLPLRCTALGLASLGLAAPGAGQTSARAPDASPPTRSPNQSNGQSNGAEHLGPGTVVALTRISSDTDGFRDTLDEVDNFGTAVASLGDFDGDGIEDFAVGSPGDKDGDDQGSSFVDGAIWLVLRKADGTVRELHKIEGGGGAGGLGHLGTSVAVLGDVDGNGVVDLALGDRDGAPGFIGGVQIVFLEADGSVKSHLRIGRNQGGFTGQLDGSDFFGDALAAIGDLDGDGIEELAVGAQNDDDGQQGAGAVWILFLGADGRVRSHQKISQTVGGFTGSTFSFGEAIAPIGDLDGDGITELAVGAFSSQVWVLFLDADGTVARSQEIAEGVGGFTGELGDPSNFGGGLTGPGDVDGDGVRDLLVGASLEENRRGTLWVLFLNADGTVRAHQKIGLGAGGFTGLLEREDRFGCAVAALGDASDGCELVVGALASDNINSDAAGFAAGGVWSLRLRADGTVAAHVEINADRGGLPNTLDDGDHFGASVAPLGDLDGDGVAELAVGAPGDDDGTQIERGAVWVLFTDEDGVVRRHQKLSATQGGISGVLQKFGGFGSAVAGLPDLDGDGLGELAVGAPGQDDGSVDGAGSVRVFFLRPDGTIRRQVFLQPGEGGFTGELGFGHAFGSALSSVGDLDNDGVADLAVGAPGDQSVGAVWLLFLRSDGTVRAQHRISALDDVGGVDVLDAFGRALAGPGDLDGDGVEDLVVGAPFDDDGGAQRGALWVLFLRSDGSLRAVEKVSSTAGFPGVLHDGERFGSSVAALGDVDGDGIADLVAGAPSAITGGDRGALWILFPRRDGSVRAVTKIGQNQGGVGTELGFREFLGEAAAGLGDLDGDGVLDLVAGLPTGIDGGIEHGALWLLELDGLATIDFEGGDDQARTALPSGRSLAAPGAFGRTLKITGGGPNLGPATFDSTPARPGVSVLDGDLLVGLGNLCLLQNPAFPAQSAPDVFELPDDAELGGTFTLGFRGPVAAHSLDLVDVERAFVRLYDSSGRARLFFVPRGWTGDLVLDGPPGWRTLDLTTLEPQRGFAAHTGAQESPGFDAAAVVALDVVLQGSGALDNLRWDPHP